MFLRSWVALALAFLFYLLIPVIGAMLVRKKWRDFRALLFQTMPLPTLTAEAVFQNLSRTKPGVSRLGVYCAYGEVDAIGPENVLWLRLSGASCTVLMEDVQVHTLSATQFSGTQEVNPDADSIESLRWKQIPSIPQGTRLLVAGELVQIDGMLRFVDSQERPLLVLLHDGIDDYVLARAVIAGRHRNEYWNPLTQVSLAVGILLMSIVLGGSFGGGSLVFFQALNITLAFSPVLPVLPPGFVLFFLYRRLWALARRYRAERDMAIIRREAAGQDWAQRSLLVFLGSIGAFAAAVLLNGLLLFFVLRLVL